ncbi:4'-phosphopantetheinyl transferase superfamily protein [Acinetobacter sp. VNH17]|uniref:Enterobactin synthase component D n=1 Tax=Acinetobacter thutiue TaxID=2998078 RepID=A0ABT7WK72_9GAMM|nr:4'-phosphopantetheinyl transferase superfamily protein [Acinetobacter thutiue]MCY6410979.1 4'-phosphopantetheinyl transferase superfamily protein [Acinetobacter thutiue]MDN0013081.1 4'-phosphopantetheinyl transferase superfamily protein [Acinetobacter thutiue]
MQLLEAAQAIALAEQVVSYTLELMDIPQIWQQYDLARPNYLLNAVPKRLNEFYAGRILAQAILQQHFSCLDSITSMSERLPIWPKGFKGSISHSNNKLVVAVSAQADYLGIDIEHIVDESFAKDSAALILTQFEQALWKTGQIHGLSFCEYLTLIFSLKESLYKAVYPVAQSYIDFLEAFVEQIDMENQSVQFSFCPKVREKYGLLESYQGYWKMQGEMVLTWVLK